jgi:hypothetical protein
MTGGSCDQADLGNWAKAAHENAKKSKKIRKPVFISSHLASGLTNSGLGLVFLFEIKL